MAPRLSVLDHPIVKSFRINGFFRLKQKADGSIDRHKVCLIAKGFDQKMVLTTPKHSV